MVNYLKSRLAIGDSLGVLKIYNLEDFECVKVIEAHEQKITSIDFKDNEFMLTGSKDRLVHIFDVNKGFELCEVLDQQFDGIHKAKFI